MSRPLRQKLLNEFIKKPRKRAEKIVKDFFDNGEIRIERKDWINVYSNALSGLGILNQGVISLTNEEWKDIYYFIAKNYVNTNHMIISPVKTYTSTTIKISYRRKNSTSNQGKVDLEEHADSQLRKVMQDYFSTGKYSKLRNRVLTEASQQTYEHGREQEPNFGSSGIYDGGGRGTVDRLRNTIKTVNQGKVQNVPGAKGTLVDKQLAAGLKALAVTNFMNEKWFTQVHEVIRLKWEELFGYGSSVTSKDSKNKVLDEVKLEGLLLPTAYSNRMRTNKGIFDRAIRKEITEFLEDEEYFMSEIIRLKPMSLMKAADLTVGSKSTKDRLNDATVKLAATTIVEGVQKKFVKNDKSKKLKSKQKKGKSNTGPQMKRGGSSKVTTKKASTRAKAGKSKTRPEATRSAVALKELINAALPQELLQRMHPPALQNRTGRFRNSAEVTNVNIGPRGGTQIDYTYMKMPYQTFEPGYAQGSVNRDPRRLIGGTIREVAQRLTGNKFITTRRR
jgi:hypothetical protein